MTIRDKIKEILKDLKYKRSGGSIEDHISGMSTSDFINRYDFPEYVLDEKISELESLIAEREDSQLSLLEDFIDKYMAMVQEECNPHIAFNPTVRDQLKQAEAYTKAIKGFINLIKEQNKQ